MRDVIDGLSPDRPVLIAGPTASGKSALALEIARKQGGVIINADASQVYSCWRVVTARPTVAEEMLAPHALYGHVTADKHYSTGHWLRQVTPMLNTDRRPIIVGGTGLYFTALTQGLAEIPPTPKDVRSYGDTLSIETMLETLDERTRRRIDIANRARVQRAWEVLTVTGRGLADWQADTPAPVMPLSAAQALTVNVQKEWLNDRIERRFEQMLEQGALEEARAVADDFDTALPAHRAIGAPELVAHVTGEMTLHEAREAVIIATRQYAKRQRTWFRSKMKNWIQIDPRHD